jgi:urease accessory protein
MSDISIAQSIRPVGTWSGAAEVCALDYTERFIRRKRLETARGTVFLVDLAQTTSLNHGDALVLNTGALIEIAAAYEALYQVTGPDMVRLAWHVGNRHTPCQLNSDYLLIQADPVIGHMLEHLGAKVTEITAPFTPEGGAYGHGRTHSHEHVATAHDH